MHQWRGVARAVCAEGHHLCECVPNPPWPQRLPLPAPSPQILVLQKKLAHFRSWVASVHSKVQQVNPQAIKNSKRLYVGNLPPDTTEVSSTGVTQMGVTFVLAARARGLARRARLGAAGVPLPLKVVPCA